MLAGVAYATSSGNGASACIRRKQVVTNKPDRWATATRLHPRLGDAVKASPGCVCCLAKPASAVENVWLAVLATRLRTRFLLRNRY